MGMLKEVISMKVKRIIEDWYKIKGLGRMKGNKFFYAWMLEYGIDES